MWRMAFWHKIVSILVSPMGKRAPVKNKGSFPVLDSPKEEKKELNLYSLLDDPESFNKEEWDIDFDDYSN